VPNPEEAGDLELSTPATSMETPSEPVLASEEPFDEEPLDEELLDEEPLDEELLDDEPLDDEPLDDEPLDDEPLDDEPLDNRSPDGEVLDGEPLESAGESTDLLYSGALPAHDQSLERPQAGPEDPGAGPSADSDDEWEPVSVLDTLRSHPAAVTVVGGIGVLALVACMVFFVGRISSSGSNSLSLPSPPDPTPAPSASVPHKSAPIRSVPKSPPSSASSSATAAATAGGAAVADPASAATPEGTTGTSGSSSPVAAGAATSPCAPGDLSITTATDNTSYAPGAQVTVTSHLVDDVACVFTPMQAGQYSCPATVLVVDATGSQVYPMSGQSEECAGVPSETLQPGTVVTVTSGWPQQTMGPSGPAQAPGGQYRAQVIWVWSAGSGSAPNQVAADSPPFSIAS
jgi:hypothetical protein